MPQDRLMAGVADVYIAPEGTAHTASLISGTPASPWNLLAGGWHNEDGIQIRSAKTFNLQRVQNEVEPVDAFLSEALLTFSLTVRDLQAEAVAYAIHGDTSGIVTVAAASGVIGTKKVNLTPDTSAVHKIAVLIRGDVAYEDGEHSNFYTPRAFVSSDFDTTLMLADASGVPIEFTALKHSTIRHFYIAQNAAATA